MIEQEFYHHGILGMKWGVRRYQNKDGTLTAAGRKRVSKLDSDKTKKKVKDSTSSNSSNKNKISELTDAELREKINRLQMEKTYSDLMKDTSPKTKSKGKQFVMDVLENSGKNIATQTTTYIMGVGVNKLFEKMGLGSDIINPKKGQKDK